MSDTAQHEFLKALDRRLWTAADQLRSNLDAAVYKHAVLGLVFLKYVSDAFKERQDALAIQFRDPDADYYLGDDETAVAEQLEVRDFYTEQNVFWVPAIARWEFLEKHAKVATNTEITLPDGRSYKFKTLGHLLDDALDAIERDNPRLKNVLPKDYARLRLEDTKMRQLLDLVATIPFENRELGLHSKDILGHVYEYFLGEFASAEGKKGGQYHTPKSIVALIVEMIEPYQGRVYDPCCGSGGFFVQSDNFIEQHATARHYNAAEQKRRVAIYGQESNPTTWQLACMNLAIRGIEFDLGEGPADTMRRDLHKSLRADFIMANPPFNMNEWGQEDLRDDPRWRYGLPPASNANFAWMQHMLYHLAPTGRMALLLSNGSMSSNTNNEGVIRRQLLEDDLVECMVALPSQLFTNTQIPACIWLLSNSKTAGPSRYDRRGQVLFIDARQKGYMKDRVLRDFRPDDVAAIASTYHHWQQGHAAYANQPGYCYSATLAEIATHDYVLTPGRYVGAEEKEADSEPFADKMGRLTATLREQSSEGARLQAIIEENLIVLGYGG
ncbi:MAG: type I restriction-modification system subunit M [Janthinobacterium lividum]